RADYVYLVRSGLVQVKKNVSSRLSVADVLNWRNLCLSLGRSGPPSAIRQLLAHEVIALVEGTEDPDRLTVHDRAEIVHGLNEAIKNPDMPALPDLKDTVAHASLHERVRSA